MATGKTTTKGSDHTHWVPLADLKFDPVINREIDPGLIALISKNFDPDAIGVLHVSARSDGSYVVIDGQHRSQAMLDMGWLDQLVECKVHRNLTISDEARLFVILNRRRNVHPIDVFDKEVKAGMDPASSIAQILIDMGLKVARSSTQTNGIAAVAALRYIYTGVKYGATRRNPKALRDTLSVVSGAWGPGPTSFNGDMLQGVGAVILRFGEGIDKPRLVERLASMPGGAGGLLGRGRTLREIRGGTVTDCVASCVVDLYNKGLRKDFLPSWFSEAAQAPLAAAS